MEQEKSFQNYGYIRHQEGHTYTTQHVHPDNSDVVLHFCFAEPEQRFYEMQASKYSLLHSTDSLPTSHNRALDLLIKKRH